jgi:hypothetical protein
MNVEGRDYKIIQMNGFLYPFSGISLGEWVFGMTCNECFFVFDAQLDTRILCFRFTPSGGARVKKYFEEASQVCPCCGNLLSPTKTSNAWAYNNATWRPVRLDRQMTYIPRFIETCLLILRLCIPIRHTVKWSIRVKLK